MTTSITKQDIENTIKDVYVKLRPWDKEPKVTISEYNERLFIGTNYDRLGYIQPDNGIWRVECITNYGSNHATHPTLEDAITYLIKIHFNMG